MANLAPCGTLTAYNRHKRKQEPVDAECQEAKRADMEQRRADKKQAEQDAYAAALAEVPETETKSELETLKDTLENLTRAIAAVSLTAPEKLAPLAKAQVEVLREIRELEGKTSQVEVDPYDSFLNSLSTEPERLTET